VDIGGSNVKILLSGQTEPRRRRSGKMLTPAKLVQIVHQLAGDWEYDVVSIGYPGLVGKDGPSSEPGNLGPGWVGFDFPAAFDRPTRIVNDAAMQALGSYEGGSMLYMGLGTGLGSALIAHGDVIALELGCLPYDHNQTLGDVLGDSGLQRLGKRAWREIVSDTAAAMMKAFVVHSVVLGGGNAKKLKPDLPHGIRLGHNSTAFRGGFRLWDAAGAVKLNGLSQV
jgi:polyphosphate glucokinase